MTLIVLRSFENESLAVFVCWQRNFKLERLDVVKADFRNMETRAQKWLKVQFAGIVLSLIGVLIVKLVDTSWEVETGIAFYFAGLLTLVIARYSSSTLSLIINMYRSHHDAFYDHIMSSLGLYIATMVAMAFYIGEQLLITGLDICLAGN